MINIEDKEIEKKGKDKEMKKEGDIMKGELDRVRNYTDRRIREVEEQARTNNQEPINSNDGPDLTQPETVSEPVMTQPPVEIIEQNEPSVVEQATEMPSSSPSPDTSNTESFQNIDKLYLFYTMSCPYSQAMLPIWYRIRDSLPSSCVPIEIDCNDVKTKPICSSFGIRGVPTIILDKTNDNNGTYRIEYSGDNTMADIVEFLKENYVFVNRFTNVENFVNLDSTIDDVQPHNVIDKSLKNMCPEVTYDKNMDRTREKYYFQLFDSRGQHGYSAGGVNEPLDKFHAAYNVVDTYLSSLPDPELMNYCASRKQKND